MYICESSLRGKVHFEKIRLITCATADKWKRARVEASLPPPDEKRVQSELVYLLWLFFCALNGWSHESLPQHAWSLSRVEVLAFS